MLTFPVLHSRKEKRGKRIRETTDEHGYTQIFLKIRK